MYPMNVAIRVGLF